MRFRSRALFSLLLIIVTVDAEFRNSCVNQNGRIGICGHLRDCNSISRLLYHPQAGGMSIGAVHNLLRKLNCGYFGRESLICCYDHPTHADQTHDHHMHTDQSRDHHMHADHLPFNGPKIKIIPNSDSSSESVKTTAQQGSSPVISVTSSTLNSSSIELVFPTQAPLAETPVQEISTTPILPALSTTSANPFSNFHSNNHGTSPQECGRILSWKFASSNATDLSDFPWATLIEYDTPVGKIVSCGGSLISKRYVLTSMGCVTSLPHAWKVSSVRLGEYNITSNPDCLSEGQGDLKYCADLVISTTVQKIIYHPKYTSIMGIPHYDIALLRLIEDVKFTPYVSPICLPNWPSISQIFFTSGWGKSTFREGTNIKYMTHLQTVDPERCTNKYGTRSAQLRNYHLCIGSESTGMPCIGDSGGALVGVENARDFSKRFTIFGILSMTHSEIGTCRTDGWPVVYTRVMDHMPWILKQIEQ